MALNLKLVIGTLALTLTLGLVACGKNEDLNTPTVDPSADLQAAKEANFGGETVTETTQEENKNQIVVNEDVDTPTVDPSADLQAAKEANFSDETTTETK